MTLWEVRRRTVVTASIVEARNETEARTKARDVWQQDAAIAALFADVEQRPDNVETETQTYWDELAALRAEKGRAE